MAQSIKHLLSKHEKPNSDPRKERTGWAKDNCNSRHWESRAREIPGAHQPVNKAFMVNSRPVIDHLSTNKVISACVTTLECILWPTHVHVHTQTYMHIHIHTNASSQYCYWKQAEQVGGVINLPSNSLYRELGLSLDGRTLGRVSLNGRTIGRVVTQR